MPLKSYLYKGECWKQWGNIDHKKHLISMINSPQMMKSIIQNRNQNKTKKSECAALNSGARLKSVCAIGH